MTGHARLEDEAPDPLAASSPPSVVTLAGWLSCWGDAGAAVEETREEDRGRALQHTRLFRDVKEGEKVGSLLL